tara:strand:- start:285 stop:713 length:429 start_codon:yes stop_codon:yes gene_type:complete
MAGSRSSRFFLFVGNDPRFINGEGYSIRQISEISQLDNGIIRSRLNGFGSFDDNNLRDRKPNARPAMTKSQRALWYSQKAKIVKSCVNSETKFLVSDDPAKLKKVTQWLKSVNDESEKFWHKMDNLTLHEIIKIAVNKGVAV